MRWRKQMKRIATLIGILLGNIIFAFGISAFTIPNEFLVGGTTGIARTVQHYLHLPVSTTVGIVNVVTFCLGLYFLGKAFAITTLLSTFFYPICLNVFSNMEVLHHLIEDKLLAAIIGGIVIGGGLGIVIRLGASTGGMDIPPLILNRKFKIPVAIGLYVFDSVILLTQVFFSDVEQILYGIVSVLITTIVLNQLLVFGSGDVQVFIISKEYQKINGLIHEQLDRGSTFIDIQTGYENISQKAVLCVLPNRDLNRLNQLVLEADKTAFMIINSAREVKGRGFTLDKHLA